MSAQQKSLFTTETADKIQIDHLTINSQGKRVQSMNQQFFVSRILNEPKFVRCHDNNNIRFVRETAISRLPFVKDQPPAGLRWMPVPQDGKLSLAAIVLCVSADNYILMMRHRNVLGLPKGFRRYVNFPSVPGKYADITLDAIESPLTNAIREFTGETSIPVEQTELQELPPIEGHARFVFKWKGKAADHGAILAEKTPTDNEADEFIWVSTSVDFDRSFKSTSVKGMKCNWPSIQFLQDYKKTM